MTYPMMVLSRSIGYIFEVMVLRPSITCWQLAHEKSAFLSIQHRLLVIILAYAQLLLLFFIIEIHLLFPYMIKWHGHCRFAATLIDQQFDAWLMNVVPISGPNTLPAIFDRGLIGVSHDWSSPPALFLFLFFNFNCLQL